MKKINLRWMYPHYRHDEFVDVTDEVWAAMYQAQREMENYERRKVYHRAYYSLEAYSWLENYALEHSRSPEDILLEREEMTTRLHLIAALPVALAHATPTQGAAIAGGLPDRKRRISRIRRTDTAIVRSHFFPTAYAGPPCPCPLYAGYESERYCRNGGYHTITGGKIHPRCTAEAAPVLCASEMDGQSMSVSQEKRCMT